MYLAFPIPARRLVSCLPSLFFSPSCTLSLLLSLSLYSPPASRSCSPSRSLWRSFSGAHRTRVRVRECREGVEGAQVGGCRGGGERTSLEDGDAGAVGVDHGPPCPRRLEGRPRHRGCQGGQAGAVRAGGLSERGERDTVDNNNYYTRWSFANAVLRRGVSGVGWEVGERSECRERPVAISRPVI